MDRPDKTDKRQGISGGERNIGFGESEGTGAGTLTPLCPGPRCHGLDSWVRWGVYITLKVHLHLHKTLPIWFPTSPFSDGKDARGV